MSNRKNGTLVVDPDNLSAVKNDRRMGMLKHGHASNGGGTPTYRAWKSMMDRCYRKTNPAYHRYGGRGIAVCREWQNSFISFLRHMGPRPSRHYSLDRIDNNGNYEPKNVRWASMKDQNSNRRDNVRLSINGILVLQETAHVHLGASKSGLVKASLKARRLGLDGFIFKGTQIKFISSP